ncbi:MAG TPA: M24 family metallopeptidase, partial [Bellilinea sp.]|nr:M24 family metallopeptidase [Bellilinea sp.]
MSWERQITIKSENELKIMRKAGQINAEALAAARDTVRPGVSTADINAAAEDVLKKYNTYSPFKNYPGPYPYPASTTVSVNEELVHGIPSAKRKVKEGDIVSIDCGTVFEGYVADSAITVQVGEVSEEVAHLLRVTEESLYAGIDKM